jgi:hypothetical protein
VTAAPDKRLFRLLPRPAHFGWAADWLGDQTGKLGRPQLPFIPIGAAVLGTPVAADVAGLVVLTRAVISE